MRLLQPGSALALDVLKMEFNKNIIIDTYQHYSKITGVPLNKMFAEGYLEDGYTIPYKEKFIVLYNKDYSNKEHTNWTLAHEIGHIYLGHLHDGAKEEVEAHWFAAELLAPEPLIRHMLYNVGVELSPHKIREIFELSKEASEKRYKTIKNKNVWSSYLCEELEDKYRFAMQKHSDTPPLTPTTVRQILASAGLEMR